MKSKGLFAISEKEFHDHIYGRKFLLFLSIILVVTIIGMATGSVEYNKQIDQYNDNLDLADEYMDYAPSWYKPSVMTIFNGVGVLLASLGAILGIAMGFDLITREKESKSLKILLSHPIYRDEVINGKAAGGIMALVLALGITFIISLGVMLIFGIVPSGEEFIYIFLFGFAAFLMIFSYFAISMFMSTVAEDSGNALVYTLIVFVFLSSLLPVFVWGSTMDLFIGEPPEYPEDLMRDMEVVRMGTVTTTAVEVSVSDSDGVTKTEAEIYDPFEGNEVWKKYMEDMENYWNKRQMVSGFVNLLSPTNNFQTIMSSLTYPNMAYMSSSIFGGPVEESGDSGVSDVLGALMWNFVALAAIPVVFFGMAYVRFMRLDVR